MSNIIIIEREEDLQAWLEKRGLTIIVRRSNMGWGATFQQPFKVTGVPAGPVGGNDPLQAVTHFVNWMFGGRFALANNVTEIVPRFTGIEEAMAGAKRSVVESA